LYHPPGTLHFGKIHSVISGFLFYPAGKVGPVPVNIVIAAFLFHVTFKFIWAFVDSATGHFTNVQ
jgi:hypothetical protein